MISSYNIYYSRYINNSNNIWFSANLIGCSECIDCDNLDNASYYISNKKYSKEEYLVRKAEFLKDKSEYLQRYTKLSNTGNFVDSSNVDGNFIISSHDIENGYFGSRYAGHIATLMIEKYLKGEITLKTLEKRMLEKTLEAEYAKPYSGEEFKINERVW